MFEEDAEGALREAMTDVLAIAAISDEDAPPALLESLRASGWLLTRVLGEEPPCSCSFDQPSPDCPHHGQCAAYGHPCHCDATVEALAWRSTRARQREALIEAAYGQIAAEMMLTIAPGLAGLPVVPPHWRDEAIERAMPWLRALGLEEE